MIAGRTGALRRPFSLALGAVLVAVAAPVFAYDTPREYLARYDADGDGRVDLREFQSYLMAGFEARDRNGDQVLDRDEQPGGGRRAVTRAQHLRALEAAFRRQDRNRDGYLEVRELAAPPAG